MQNAQTTQDGGGQPVATGDRPKECDLVMKGGITSGIVYPPLVIKLHEHGYSFRNVGGTSAGAIAAAVTAAAEYGKAKGGFQKLKTDVQQWLGEGSHLRNLFQPSRSTAPLMDTAFGYSSPSLSWLKWPLPKAFAALLLNDAPAFLAGAVLGAAVSSFFGWLVSGDFRDVTRGWGLVVLFVWALIGGFAAGAGHLYHILKRAVPANGFGLCKGRGKDLGVVDETVLTDWFFARINDLAGMGKAAGDAPLTFGELWKLHDPAHDRKRGREIDLRMMTSDLSQNQPYVLPFEHDLFVFNEEEMLEYFPPGVVRHMVAHARECRGLSLPKGYHFLPKAKALPVIFAARLSLSFPVLISMVPLYTISPAAFRDGQNLELFREGGAAPGPGATAREVRMAEDEAEEVVVLRGATLGGESEAAHAGGGAVKIKRRHLQRNWFSDGGICSNFPIHFFDAWLPSRPTFGVNLTSQLSKGVPQGGSADAMMAETIKGCSSAAAVRPGQTEKPAPPDAYGRDVYLPKADEIVPPEWIALDGLGKFLGTIFRTAQNYRDNMQAMLPSYRERIVQVRLTEEEGGLNLNMDPEIISRVVGKGDAAAAELLSHFDLPKHQWVRFRVLMRQMEKSLYDLKEQLASGTFYDTTLSNPPLGPDYPYPRPPGWLTDAHTRLNEIGRAIDAIQKLNPEVLFSDESPLPEPVLRVTPQI